MSNETKLVSLPPYLVRRLQAFQVVAGDRTTYVLRDKLNDRTHDLEQWQFFILEVLAGCEELARLKSVFADRFGREVSERELLDLFGQLADAKLWDASAATHPLLKPFTEPGYVMEKGVLKPKSYAELAARLAAAPQAGGTVPPAAAAAATAAAGAAATPAADGLLVAGVQDAIGLDPRRSVLDWKLFQAKPVVARLLPFCEPLRYVGYVLPLMFFAALMVVGQYFDQMWADLVALRYWSTLLTHAAFSLVTIDLTVRFTQAMIGYKYRGEIGYGGIILRFGFFPRFLIDVSNTEQMSRRERMWMHGGPLLVRFFLFSFGVFVWLSFRAQNGLLSEIGLVLAFLCALNVVLEGGNPLVKGNAYHLLCAFLDVPNVRYRAYRALMDKVRGGASTEQNSSILSTYALASFIYAYAVVLMMTYSVTRLLLVDWNIGNAGIIVCVIIATFLTVRSIRRIQLQERSYSRSVQFDRWRKRALPAEGGAVVQVETTSSRVWRYVKMAGLLTALIVMFLPYPYESGGNFQIYPLDRQVLTTDIPGLIDQVHFDGGEAVKRGTVVARVMPTDLLAQIAVLDAKIVEQKSVIADLKTRPKPEEVRLAERELDVAQERARFSGDRVPRYRKLLDDRVISFEEFETARREAEVDAQEVAKQQAHLELVKVGVTAEHIAAEEAKLRAFIEERNEVAGREQRTPMKMPFDGNILTLHLNQKLNSFLEKGQPFAVVEFTGQVTAEVDLPETEIAYVKLGAPARATPNAFYERTFAGKVQTIDNNVTIKPYGNVVKVIVLIDNPKGELRTGMTGYAKIGPVWMPVWKAFTTAVVRFFAVQVWSWIP
jgi:putative peptide zinc metalloprotease protein